MTRWQCPSCGFRDVTSEIQPHTRMHSCPALADLTVPMIQVTDELEPHEARHVLVDRDDYIGTERVQLDGEGRPIMAVRTERSDGSNDTTIYAPVATVQSQRTE